jgi:hypothetical protein
VQPHCGVGSVFPCTSKRKIVGSPLVPLTVVRKDARECKCCPRRRSRVTVVRDLTSPIKRSRVERAARTKSSFGFTIVARAGDVVEAQSAGA